MAPIASEESKRLGTIPRGKNVGMSYEDTLRELEAYLDGRLAHPQPVQDSQEDYADITEPINSNAIKLPEISDLDATEKSSSFGDTISRDDLTSITSDAEVESEFRADHELDSRFDRYSSVFPTRKKKLTNQWRNFIRPLMWRCKWTELKIRELKSQALKYTQKLESNNQTKMLEQHQYTSNFCSKLFPFVSHSVRKKPMKRRKRKPVENVTDISSYMSHHNIFSYHENKKSDQDSTATPEDDCSKEIVIKNDEFDVDDDWLKKDEDSMKQILRQIGTVQSQVHRLRNHLDMVMLKNGVTFSSSENLSFLAPCDGQTSAAQSPAFSAGNGDNMSLGTTYAPQNISDFDIGVLGLPDSIVSGYVDVTQIPDVIESTVGLLSATDVTIQQPQIVESAENILDDTVMQINDVKVKDENMSRGVTDHSIDEYQVPEMKEQNISVLPVKTESIPNLVAGHGTPPEITTLKSCITSDDPTKNKRRRGERKAGPGGWNLKCSGEPDST